MTADQLRSAFLSYFSERDHRLAASVGLIPNHPAAPLFTNAGMVAFLPYFLGEEAPPTRRATSSQKCVRVRGKHDDIEAIGRTTRHLTFFEMLGNFSFGDYFKEGAIRYAWEFLTEVLGLPGDRLWATVHRSDDDAEQLWRDAVGMPAERIQRLDEDNFWEMGPTGPCGPSSEIFYDKGPEFGADGGPEHGGEERFVEIWNLVFMQYNRIADGSLHPLPEQNIDTGAGLERILPILQGTSSVFETNVLRSLIGTAERLCGATYGADPEDDVSLRILADHARAVTFLIADGVVPSNEERGYVLRRIIRRAALHGKRAGAATGVLPEMAAAVAEVMRAGYPELGEALDGVQATLEREEHRFRDILTVGLSTLESSIADDATEIPGSLAFKLHDTHGLPIDVTREIARERGLSVDEAGFEEAMEHQRAQARAAEAAAATGGGTGSVGARTVLERFGTTDFRGYDLTEGAATVLGVFPTEDPKLVEVFVDATPFYPEGGGQIGDTGSIESEFARGEVIDTDAPLPSLIRHHVKVESGSFEQGQSVYLRVLGPRRAALRRSHTGTHLLHWALREVLGPTTRQQGSLVAPDYLRFDFSHHDPVDDNRLQQVETLVVEQIRSNTAVETVETSFAKAKEAGAISFFGDKYGETVRMVRAGEHSVELCGGTHVHALGDVGEFAVRTESSIGANIRRVEAVVGQTAHDDNYQTRALVRSASRLLRTPPDGLLDALERTLSQQRTAEKERKQLVARLDQYLARDLTRNAENGVVVTRCDGRDQNDLRQLATIALSQQDIRAVGLIGSPDGTSVAIAVAVATVKQGGLDAPAAARLAAKVVNGGGGGKDPRIAVAGGRLVAKIDEAISVLRSALLG
jgi:alanyl-tRNA synthetase